MGASPKIELGELVCWWCGYGLDGVDLMRSDLKCPECGKDNIPSNGPESPLVRRPWPAWWTLLGIVCWPGALLGVGVGLQWLTMKAEWLDGLKGALGIATLPAAGFSLFWAPLIAELLVDERVAGMHRRRWLIGVAVGGIVGNGVVAASIALSFRILAGS